MAIRTFVANDMDGEECVIVFMGRAFRCRVERATMNAAADRVEVTSFGGADRVYVQGLTTRRMSFDYLVLGEVTLTEGQRAETMRIRKLRKLK
jgi:hypothetical protein